MPQLLMKDIKIHTRIEKLLSQEGKAAKKCFNVIKPGPPRGG